MYGHDRQGRLRHWYSELFDGENRWGFVRIQIDRFGVTRYRLVVYPPGISDEERRRLRMWRGLPIWSAALWVVLEVFLQELVGPLLATVTATTVIAVLAIRARRRAGVVRNKVRTMGVVTMPGYTTSAMLAARDRLRAMAELLADADLRMNEQQMTPIEHEVLWWQVYEQLEPVHTATKVRETPQ
jgi:hypothetical protein